MYVDDLAAVAVSNEDMPEEMRLWTGMCTEHGRKTRRVCVCHA